MERVEIYGVQDGMVAMGVFVDDKEIACPLIEWDFEDNCLGDWSDGNLNCAEAEDKGMTADDVSAILERQMDKINTDVLIEYQDNLAMYYIGRQLNLEYGKGTGYAVVTHPDMNPEEGLMYGDNECIEDNPSSPYYGYLYTWFQPYDSAYVYQCFYEILEGEADWSNIDYANPDGVELSDRWGYPE